MMESLVSKEMKNDAEKKSRDKQLSHHYQHCRLWAYEGCGALPIPTTRGVTDVPPVLKGCSTVIERCDNSFLILVDILDFQSIYNTYLWRAK